MPEKYNFVIIYTRIMRILVLNAGSSSLKFSFFDFHKKSKHFLLKGEFEGFDGKECNLCCEGELVKSNYSKKVKLSSVRDSISLVPDILREFGLKECDAVGHRVVHGGSKFHDATIISDEVIDSIKKCIPLAPLHNPANLEAINLSRKIWKDIPHIAVFDTAFHHKIPESVHRYAVPEEWYRKGLKRYGFHGTSHEYVSERIARELGTSLDKLKIISCHLGNGASVCAIKNGISVDTSMGMTPLEGLVMGTRSGDIDPGIFGFINKELGLDLEEIENSLFNDSGLKALAGTNDMRLIEKKYNDGDKRAKLAIEIYSYRIKKYIGSYAASMNGMDVLIFTGGVGENSSLIREKICEDIDFLGINIDKTLNESADLSDYKTSQIQLSNAQTKIFVTRTREQYMIAKKVADIIS